MAWTLRRTKWIVVPDPSVALQNKKVANLTEEDLMVVKNTSRAVRAEGGLLGLVFRMGPETEMPPSRVPVRLLEVGEVIVHLVGSDGLTVGELLVNASQCAPVKHRTSIPACRLVGAPDWKGTED